MPESIEIGKGCPYGGRTIKGNLHPCVKHDCFHYRPIQTTMPDPQREGETIQSEQWDCVHVLNFIVNMDTGRKTNQVGAAVESFRNNMDKTAAMMIGLKAGNIKLMDGKLVAVTDDKKGLLEEDANS